MDKAANNGMTPLYIASQNNNLDVVKHLCEKGVDVNKQNKYSSWTPLHSSVRRYNIDVLRLLVEEGDAAYNIKSYQGETAFHYACLNRYLMLIEYLLESNLPLFIASTKVPY